MRLPAGGRSSDRTTLSGNLCAISVGFRVRAVSAVGWVGGDRACRKLSAGVSRKASIFRRKINLDRETVSAQNLRKRPENCYRSRGETMTKRSSLAAIGEPVVRKEDAELITGQGRFSDDVNVPGQAYAVMVRSPHAHAGIGGIAVVAAMAVPGVIAVLTGADAVEDGLKPIPHRPILGPPDITLGKRDASDKFLSPHRVLPNDKARFAGEAVAMVVAAGLTA